MTNHILGDNDLRIISDVMGVDTPPTEAIDVFSRILQTRHRFTPGRPLDHDTAIVVCALSGWLQQPRVPQQPRTQQGVEWGLVPPGQPAKVCPDGLRWYDCTFRSFDSHRQQVEIDQAGRLLWVPTHIVQLVGEQFDPTPKRKLRVVHDEPSPAGQPIDLRARRQADGRPQEPEHHPQSEVMPIPPGTVLSQTVSERMGFTEPDAEYAFSEFATESSEPEPESPPMSDNPWEDLEPGVSRINVNTDRGIKQATFMGIHEGTSRIWGVFDEDPAQETREISVTQAIPDWASMGAADDPSNPNPKLDPARQQAG